MSSALPELYDVTPLSADAARLMPSNGASTSAAQQFLGSHASFGRCQVKEPKSGNGDPVDDDACAADRLPLLQWQEACPLVVKELRATPGGVAEAVAATRPLRSEATASHQPARHVNMSASVSSPLRYLLAVLAVLEHSSAVIVVRTSPVKQLARFGSMPAPSPTWASTARLIPHLLTVMRFAEHDCCTLAVPRSLLDSQLSDWTRNIAVSAGIIPRDVDAAATDKMMVVLSLPTAVDVVMPQASLDLDMFIDAFRDDFFSFSKFDGRGNQVRGDRVASLNFADFVLNLGRALQQLHTEYRRAHLDMCPRNVLICIMPWRDTEIQVPTTRREFLAMVHRDSASGELLWSSNFCAVLADFESSMRVGSSPSPPDADLHADPSLPVPLTEQFLPYKAPERDAIGSKVFLDDK